MIVLDVNAAVAIVKGIEEGLALRGLILDGETITAPHFFITELGNVAWKYVRAGELSEEGSHYLLERTMGLVNYFVSTEELLIEAIHEAIRNEHPVYDMLYMVLARRNGATLFTLDKRLRQICVANGVNCVEPMRL